jgi:hypothetical protein
MHIPIRPTASHQLAIDHFRPKHKPVVASNAVRNSYILLVRNSFRFS